MSKKIQVISNCLGEGDWVVIKIDGQVFHSGHSVSLGDMINLLSHVAGDESVELIELDDEEIMQYC